MNEKSGPFRLNWKKLPTVIVGLFSLGETAPTKNRKPYGTFPEKQSKFYINRNLRQTSAENAYLIIYWREIYIYAKVFDWQIQRAQKTAFGNISQWTEYLSVKMTAVLRNDRKGPLRFEFTSINCQCSLSLSFSIHLHCYAAWAKLIYFSLHESSFKHLKEFRSTLPTILTVIMFELTVFRDSKQLAIECLSRMRDFVTKNSVNNVGIWILNCYPENFKKRFPILYQDFSFQYFQKIGGGRNGKEPNFQIISRTFTCAWGKKS